MPLASHFPKFCWNLSADLEKLFSSSELYAAAEDFNSQLEFVGFGECGSDSEVGVLRIASVGVSRTGGCERYTHGTAKLINTARASFGNVQAEEVAAAGFGPVCDIEAVEVCVEDFFNEIELGTDDVGTDYLPREF